MFFKVCQVTLRLFDSLLQSPLPVVMEEFTNTLPLEYSTIVHPEMLHTARLELEEEIIAYLSLIPDCLSSYKSVNGEYGLDLYLREAQHEVSCTLYT